jgi:hypothetical protein
MIDSGHCDKTAGREGRLLNIRYANRNKNHTFSIYFKQCRAVPVHNRRTFQVRNAAASQLAPKLFWAGSCGYFPTRCCAVLVHSRRTFQVRNPAGLAAAPEGFRGWKLLLSSVVLSFSIFAEIDRRFPCRSLSPERRPIWSRRRNIQRSRCS